MNWFALSVIAVFGIQGGVTATRLYPGVIGTLIYSAMCLFITAPSLGRAFATGPSFALVQFTQAGMLDIAGILISYFVFHEVLSAQQYIGISFIIIGMFTAIKF